MEKLEKPCRDFIWRFKAKDKALCDICGTDKDVWAEAWVVHPREGVAFTCSKCEESHPEKNKEWSKEYARRYEDQLKE